MAYLGASCVVMENDNSDDDANAVVEDLPLFSGPLQPRRYQLLSERSEAERERADMIAELYSVPNELGRCIWSGPEFGNGVPVFVKTSPSTGSARATGLSMVDFDLVASDTVGHVKDTIQFWLGIPQNQQRWRVICVCGEIFTDMEIADDRCVVEVFSEYNFGLSRRLPLYIYVTFR